MKTSAFTVFVVPDRDGVSRRLRVSKKALYGAILGGICAFGFLAGFLIHYTYVVSEVFEANNLRRQNQELIMALTDLEVQMEQMETSLTSLGKLDEKLRSMTTLADDVSGLAIGPLKARKGAGGPAGGALSGFSAALPLSEDPVMFELGTALMESRVLGLSHQAEHQLSSLTELVSFFEAQETLLAHTPSLWPIRGWMTSRFGLRDDPYTGEKSMHSGVDLAAAAGTKVVAPAHGMVIFAGTRGAYGKMIIIEHGMGLVTHYGHLSKVLVRVGDEIERGQHIGAVGNTGRSTGPHLHYEVRVDGIPVDPEQYVLD
ncbi:MAG: peptidase M23 [Myxococcales bacterium]|nr:peptidase M23 [Myxococcales bacterium]|tara:strand:+ start:146 stop:1090 length:945 start_codon:yes stop_codon:yes gene_type:complete